MSLSVFRIEGEKVRCGTFQRIERIVSLALADPSRRRTCVMALFDKLYSFDRDTLIKAIPRPEKTSAKEFTAAAEELFDRIMQMADNAGATDQDRALNYLAVRFTSERNAKNC